MKERAPSRGGGIQRIAPGHLSFVGVRVWCGVVVAPGIRSAATA